MKGPLAPNKVALFQHPDCSRHDTGWHHPEHQGRLRGLMQALEAALPQLHQDIVPVFPDPIEEAVLTLAHTERHIARVRAACDRAIETDTLVNLDPDTVVSSGSWDAACAAVACGVAAVDGVLSGTYRAGFCAVRPPGHHATTDAAMGFCLFNATAIAAEHALRSPDVNNVLIADWDVHHGNGTQDIFYENPAVYFFSMHQSPFYPGTGHPTERGQGAGAGKTLNVPLSPGLPPAAYVDAFVQGLDTVLQEFEPDIVLVSAGFDAGQDDPLGGFTLRPEDFAEMTKALLAKTERSAHGRVIMLLEGGYNPQELGINVVATLKALAGAPRAHGMEPRERTT